MAPTIIAELSILSHLLHVSRGSVRYLQFFLFLKEGLRQGLFLSHIEGGHRSLSWGGNLSARDKETSVLCFHCP